MLVELILCSWLFLFWYWKRFWFGKFWYCCMIVVRCGFLIVMLCIILFLLWKFRCSWVLCIFVCGWCKVVRLKELFLWVYLLLLMCISVVFSSCISVVSIRFWFSVFVCWCRLCVMWVWMCGSVWLKVCRCLNLVLFWVVI